MALELLIVAFGILLTQLASEPKPLALEAQALTTGPPGKSPELAFHFSLSCIGEDNGNPL